jgi:glucose-1-phosphate thymidylyltransferase
MRMVGLVPAAGAANRISPLPCSKEILPIGFQGDKVPKRVKVVSHCLLENMGLAGVDRAFIILREGKWDVPGYLGNGRMMDMKLAYLLTPCTGGVPFTLDAAFDFVKDDIIVFGFPDILLKPKNAFKSLLECLNDRQADLVLGLFWARQPSKVDMVQLDDVGRVCCIDIKPQSSDLTYTWIIAVWTPVFTRFIHHFVAARCRKALPAPNSDPSARSSESFLGDVINAAIREKIRIDQVIFRNGDFLDIGTPDDLAEASTFIADLNR